MSRTMHNRIRGLAFALLGGFLLLALGACNDNPKENNTVSVPLAELLRQLGFTSTVSSPPSNDVNSGVHTLVIGPLVVGSGSTRTEKYSTDDLSEAVKDQLIDDAVNSAAFLQIESLPTSTELLEFTTPPPSAGNWQLMVAAFTKQFTSIGDVSDNDAIADSVAYYGFTDYFLNSASLPSAPISITLRRACLLDNPPKGCAAYSVDATNGVKANVTTGVEIWQVYSYANGSPDYTQPLLSTPLLVVAGTPGAGQVSPAQAASTLESIGATATSNGKGTNPGYTLAVVTTHRGGLDYAEDCGTGTTFNDDSSGTQPSSNLGFLTAPAGSDQAAAADLCFQVYATPYN